MSSNALIIQGVGIVVAVACTLPGVFLVLRRAAMVSDAISHSVLFGIVVGMLAFQLEIGSPYLILLAALSGLLTVWLVELVIKTGRLANDAAIGLVFPILFSLAIVLVNVFARNAHIDEHVVLLGELVFAPINRMKLFGTSIPEGFVVMGSILVANIVLLLVFYKELKITTFDPGLAAALGFSPTLIHYGLMSMVSITAVGAFDHVGAILTVALMIVPPATAYLLTNSLKWMIILSGLLGALSAISGYWVSNWLNINTSGTLAAMTGVYFALALVFAPEHGLLARFIEAARRRRRFALEMLMVHLFNHENTPEQAVESSMSHLRAVLNWQNEEITQAAHRAVQTGLAQRNNGQLELTDKGRQLAKTVMAR
jgi:manganese/zinc/iron transport system permease protein